MVKADRRLVRLTVRRSRRPQVGVRKSGPVEVRARRILPLARFFPSGEVAFARVEHAIGTLV
jgi:hypothetical protein